MPLLKQLAHCPDKRQHSPTNANKRQQSGQCAPAVGVNWRMLAFVGYCRKSSTCSVGSGKVGECLPNVERFPTSDSSQLGSTRVHNILELSWMSLLCWLSASLLKKTISLEIGRASCRGRVY